MAEEYEVPSPHESATEKKVEEEGGLSQKIALMTAVLATVGALISYKSGTAQNEAMFLKNESILKQAQASDQWAFYQAKSTKSHLDATAIDLATDPAVKQKYTTAKTKEDKEKAEIQTEAKKLAEESKKLGEQAEAKLFPHERLALALTFIQIAITMAAITILTKKHWLIWASVGFSITGIAAAATAFMM